MKIALFVTEDWYVCSHRLPVIREAVARGHDVVVLTRVDRHREPIEAAGARLVPVTMNRSGWNPVAEQRLLREVRRALLDHRPDVLHNVALKPVIYGTTAARLARTPVVLNALAGLGALFLTNEGAGVLRQALRAALTRALRARGVSVLVQNADDADIVHGLGVGDANVTVIRGSGVDLTRFCVRPAPAEPPLRVLFVGRLLYDKGVEDLYEASRRLRTERPELQVSVELAGDRDPHNPACVETDTLARWSATGDVTFLGAREDIPDLVAGSHVVVLPSYREGLPKALLEAAACGRPMVATDVPGCREVVLPGETGVLVPPRRPDLLATAIGDLAVDPDLRRRMGDAARKLAEDQFSDVAVAAQTVNLYEQLAGR